MQRLPTVTFSIGILLLATGPVADARLAGPARPVPLAPRSAVAQDVRTAAEWEALFVSAWDDELGTYTPLSESGDSWDLYNLAYAIDANYAMFRASDKTDYLDRALFYIQNAIGKAQVSSSLPRSQFKDGYLTWANHSHPSLGDDGREYSLFESYAWRYVTCLLRAMREETAVYNNSGYRKEYDDLLAFTEEHIWEKWYRRGLNRYLYRSRTHMASHWALIATNLALLTKDSAKRTQYETVRDDINFSGMRYWSFASLRGQMIPNPVDSSAYFWSDVWNSTVEPGQDVAHGNAVVTHIVESHDLGEFWTAADVTALVRLLDKVIWPGPQKYAKYVDGSGDGIGWFNDGFIKLGRYDADLQRRLENHRVGRNTQFYGNGALNAKLLTGGVSQDQRPHRRGSRFP